MTADKWIRVSFWDGELLGWPIWSVLFLVPAGILHHNSGCKCLPCEKHIIVRNKETISVSSYAFKFLLPTTAQIACVCYFTTFNDCKNGEIAWPLIWTSTRVETRKWEVLGRSARLLKAGVVSSAKFSYFGFQFHLFKLVPQWQNIVIA